MQAMGIGTLATRLASIWRKVLLVHLGFALLGATLFWPLFGALLQLLLEFSGEPAVADQDIALLLLSPLGLTGGVLMASLFMAIIGLEMGAMMALSIGTATRRAAGTTPLRAIRYTIWHIPRLLRLTLGLSLRILAWLLPFLGAVAAVGWWLLTEYDINYYLSHRPPVFILALVFAGAMGLLLAWFLAPRLAAWTLALPLGLLDDAPIRQVFAECERLAGGHRRALLSSYLGWALVFALGAALPGLFIWLSTGWMVQEQSADLIRLVPLLGAITLVWLVLGFLGSAMGIAGFTVVIAYCYMQLGGALPEREKAPDRNSRSLPRWQVAGIALSGLIAALAAGVWLLGSIQLEDTAVVIAHRGASAQAPENTLAAVRRAIEDGSEWVEIDVQETRDGHIVVTHDSDFMKQARNPLKVWNGTLDEIRQIDVGSWFHEDYADERVPTLQEVLALIGPSDSRLVIELKYYGHDQQLEQRVVEIVEAAGMTQQVVVMSLSGPGIRKLQQLRPEWVTGRLAATAIGDVSREAVDFLAVSERMASRDFIYRAQQRGRQVYVWTINNPLAMSRWMSQGVDGIITDEPALARQILAQRAQLSSAERLVLSAALLFGNTAAMDRPSPACARSGDDMDYTTCQRNDGS